MSNSRDVDSAEVAFRLRATAYGLIVGAVAAGIAFMFSASILNAILAFVIVGGGVAAGALYLAERGARIGASLYRPSGSSTPAVREYSYADSLVARGQPEQAVAAYAELTRQHPEDPEPRLRRARVLRDQLRRYDDAVAELKGLLKMSALKSETELVALREIVEIHLHKQQQSARALPYLARIAEKYAGTPTAEWARNEAREIKASMKHES